ncbi:MAG: tRNA (5-methylaminomethyl-2-thiouridine)(34)-methyltransferase MnmD [Bacteroidota bacterium]|nr:tRNA (5-methylaminomethyl-2-thiouridine)(34)-methyltransferase MnmD [Bacteroidota bacterium]
MQREIQLTADGSHTLLLKDKKSTYHSLHGAISESRHVFIQAGLLPFLKPGQATPVRILEIGFGTGLNALLTMIEADRWGIPVSYTAVEPYPLTAEEFGQLNYGELLNRQHDFITLHTIPDYTSSPVSPFFTLLRLPGEIHKLKDIPDADCIFFDAFSPTDQPDMWTEEVFSKLFQCLAPAGTLVTYCSKTTVRKELQSVGFTVTKIPGPFGKREMVRAIKSTNS